MNTRRIIFGVLFIAVLITTVINLNRFTAVQVAQANKVLAAIEEHCAIHNTYPAANEIDEQFPGLLDKDSGWFYWPAEDLRMATLQYPVKIQSGDAPGNAKISEFMPWIYAYAVRNPCGVFPEENDEVIDPPIRGVP